MATAQSINQDKIQKHNEKRTSVIHDIVMLNEFEEDHKKSTGITSVAQTHSWRWWERQIYRVTS